MSESSPSQIIEAVAAAMTGQTVEQYRQEVKERAAAYRRINELACQIRKERDES